MPLNVAVIPRTVLTNRKSVHRGLAKRITWMNQAAGERRLIRRIGVVLRFQTERRVLLVACALGGTVEKIRRIELNSGLSGQHFHSAARLWIEDRCGQRQRTIL